MQEQQKVQDAEEDYQFWRQGIPFIYEQMISQELTWPSLTVQFLKGITIDENGNQRHRFIHSTTTGCQEPEYLKICGVTLPTTNSLAEKEDFEVADERWKKQNCGIVSEDKIYEVPAEINRARIHPSKDNIVAAQIANSDIGLFNIDLGEIIYLNGQIKEGYGISWSTLDDKLISSSYDQLVYLWDCVSQKLISKFSHHTQIVEDVSWCPDSPFEFLSCSDDGTIALGDLRDSKIVNLINAHSQEVNCVQYNPFDNSNQFASGSEDCNTKIFDKRNMKELHLLEGHDKAVLSLQWSPHQSNYLITGSKDSKVILWNLLRIGNEIRAEDEKDGPSEMVLSHCGHKKQINDISWSQNVNQLFISTDQDNIVQLWKIQNEILDDENDNDQIISKIIKGQ